MGDPSPIARLADLRQELKVRIEAQESDTEPSFWPPLDLLIRELMDGSSRHHPWSVAMAIRKVAVTGVGYEEARKRVEEAALELAEDLDPHGIGAGS